MNKKIGAIFLIAGTCIGSGMIALPMVMAKLGLIPSFILMIFVWALMYYTSLINIELNLQSKKVMSLGSLGFHFVGPITGFIGNISLKLLSFSLLAVFINGTSSVISEILSQNKHLFLIETTCAIFSILILLLPIKTIDYINRTLFIFLLCIFLVLLFGVITTINWNNLPLYSDSYTDIKVLSSVIPIVFTSFGFQVIFHTLTDYCKKDPKLLRNSFFYGSAIPALIYIFWTCGILGSIYNHNNEFYNKMINGQADVGNLIAELSQIAKWQSIQLLVWWLSLVAIITSIIGVGRGLCDSLLHIFKEKISNTKLLGIISSVCTIGPAYIVSILVPNAFIVVLGFAGMILSIIAIILPIYIFLNARFDNLEYKLLNKKSYLYIAVLIGMLIVIAECTNLLF